MSIVTPEEPPESASVSDVAQVFGRLITEGLLSHTLSPYMAEEYGKKAGHYGLIALRLHEARAEWERSFEDFAERRGWTTSQPVIPELENN